MKPLPRYLKRWHLEKMLEQGMVMVHLDARRVGVSVPAHLATDAHLRLNLSYRFSPCDLEVLDDEATVTLSFGGQPWLCRLPFDAVFGITNHSSGESLMWFEDMPDEVVDSLATEDDSEVATMKVSDMAPGSVRHLRAIDGGGLAKAAPQCVEDSQSAMRLRLVK